MGFDLLCSPSSPLSFLSLLLQRPIIESPSPFYPIEHFNNFFGCLTIANKKSYKKASPVSNWNLDGNWTLRKALPILVLEFLIFKMPEWSCDSPLWDSPRAHREPTLCTWERNVSISTGGLNIKIQQSQGGSSGNYSAVVQEWGLTVIKLNTGTEFRQYGGSWDLSLTTSSLNVASLRCLFSKRWWVGGSRFNSLIGGSCTDARIQGRSMCYNSK